MTFPTVKIKVSASGQGTVSIDDYELKGVTAVTLVARANSLTRVAIVLDAHVEADVQVELDKLKIRHAEPPKLVAPPLCNGGMIVYRDPCEHCGATSDEDCKALGYVPGERS